MDKEGRGGGRGRRGEEDLVFVPEVQKHWEEQVCYSLDVESQALTLF